MLFGWFQANSRFSDLWTTVTGFGLSAWFAWFAAWFACFPCTFTSKKNLATGRTAFIYCRDISLTIFNIFISNIASNIFYRIIIFSHKISTATTSTGFWSGFKMKVGQKSCTHQSFADPAYQIFELFKYAHQIFKCAYQMFKYACQIFNYLNIQTKYSNFHTKYSAFEISIPNSHLLKYSYQIFGGFPDHFRWFVKILKIRKHTL